MIQKSFHNFQIFPCINIHSIVSGGDDMLPYQTERRLKRFSSFKEVSICCPVVSNWPQILFPLSKLNKRKKESVIISFDFGSTAIVLYWNE